MGAADAAGVAAVSQRLGVEKGLGTVAYLLEGVLELVVKGPLLSGAFTCIIPGACGNMGAIKSLNEILPSSSHVQGFLRLSKP